MSEPDSRARILGALRAAKRPAEVVLRPPAAPRILAPKPGQEPADRFLEELRTIGGEGVRAKGVEAAREAIVDLARQSRAARAVVTGDELVESCGIGPAIEACGVSVERPAAWDGPAPHADPLWDLSVTGAECALAASGTLLHLAGPGQARRTLFLGETHAVLLRIADVVWDLPEAFDRLAKKYPNLAADLPNRVTLVTGPSRTADIEQTLTLGAHGPRRLCVVIIE